MVTVDTFLCIHTFTAIRRAAEKGQTEVVKLLRPICSLAEDTSKGGDTITFGDIEVIL